MSKICIEHDIDIDICGCEQDDDFTRVDYQVALLDKIDSAFIDMFEDKLFECKVTRETPDSKKQCSMPKGWQDLTKDYDSLPLVGANSIAVRTGKGLIVVDVDTKDLKLLDNDMQILVSKWLEDKATFIVETTNGYHFYFDDNGTTYASGVNISPMVDIRGAGGCVFAYSDDANSNYEIISNKELLPITTGVIEYIQLQKKDNKTTEYSYSNGIKIASDKWKPNNNLRLAMAMPKDNMVAKIDAVIEAVGMTPEDFSSKTNGLYVLMNKLAYMLSMSQEIANNEVYPILRVITDKKLGFDPDSGKSKEMLNQMLSNMIYNDERKQSLRELLKKHSVEVHSNLEILNEKLLFLKGGVNLVIGEAKSGKTFTTIASLVNVGLRDNIIHIDFDRNADKKLEGLGVETYHISSSKELFASIDAMSTGFDSLKDTILVIDSLQDLSLDEGLDTNSGALETMNRVLRFKETGATVIVVHHTTLGDDKKPKVKGNATTIMSKSDITITLERTSKETLYGSERLMTIHNTRAEDITGSGTQIVFKDNRLTKSRIDAIKKEVNYGEKL